MRNSTIATITIIFLAAGHVRAEWQTTDRPKQRPNCSFIGNVTFDGHMSFEANCKVACELTPECNTVHGNEPQETHTHTCQMLTCANLQNINWVKVHSYTPRQTWIWIETDTQDFAAADPIQINIINITRYIDVVRYFDKNKTHTRYKTQIKHINKAGVKSMCTIYDSIIGCLVIILAICMTIIAILVKKKRSEKQQIHVLYNTN